MQCSIDSVPADMSGSTLERLSVRRLFVLLFATMLLQVTVTDVAASDLITDLYQQKEKEIAVIFGPLRLAKMIDVEAHNTSNLTVEECECIPINQCSDSTIITNGTRLIDYRNTGTCGNYTLVCCKESDRMDPEPAVSRRICGHWNSNGFGFKIKSNVEAQYTEFPWMMAILRLDPLNQSKHIMHCGGSLIHPRVVLTTVHCVRGLHADELLIRGGEWDLQKQLELFKHQDRQVNKIIEHSQYYSGASHNNVALIIVTQPFLLNEAVGTICLPSQNFVFNDKICFSSGWVNNVTDDNDLHSQIMKKIELPIVSRGRCSEIYKNKLGSHFDLHESVICAGGESGKGVCIGDGGNPLMCPIKDKPEQFHQAGIVSWGISCGTQTPVIFVNVALFRHWIDEHMDNEKLEKNYYDPEFIPDTKN